ncbi:MAG TPA: MFS transporter, partial [Pseudomonadales bacterium]|nr:MFS transporter [Pseudomonadales bacterium]
MTTDADRLTPVRIATFASAAFPVGALGVTLGVYLTNYYASHVGLPLAAVGIAFMAVRLIDIVFDPLLGIAIDHTRTAIGKFRPWLALSAPVLIVAAYAMYFPPQGASIFYLVGWLLVLYAGFSMLTLSQAGWGATLVAEYHQRSSVYGWIQAVGVLGAVGVLLLPTVMPIFWKGMSLHSVPLMGTFVLIALVIGTGMTIFFAYEPEREGVDRNDRFGIMDYLPLVKRPETLRLIVTDLFCTLGPAITAPLYLFFFEQARLYTPSQATLLLLIYILAGLVAPAAWSQVAHRFGKHQTIRIS